MLISEEHRTGLKRNLREGAVTQIVRLSRSQGRASRKYYWDRVEYRRGNEMDEAGPQIVDIGAPRYMTIEVCHKGSRDGINYIVDNVQIGTSFTFVEVFCR